MNELTLKEEIKKFAHKRLKILKDEYFSIAKESYYSIEEKSYCPKLFDYEDTYYRFVARYRFGSNEVEFDMEDRSGNDIAIFRFAELKKSLDNYDDLFFIKIDLDELEEIIPEKYKELLKEDMASLRTRKRKIENGDIKSEIAEIEHEIKHRQEKLEKLKKEVEE